MSRPAEQLPVAASTDPVLPAAQTNPQFVAIHDRKNKLVEAAERAVINDPLTLEMGADLTKMIRVAAKKADDLRLYLVKPIKDHANKIDADFRPIARDLEKAERTIKDKIKKYMDEQDRQAVITAAAAKQAQEEAALTEAEIAEQAGNKAQAEEILTEAAKAPAPAPVSIAPVVRGDLGGSISRRTVWKYEILDQAKVPDRFKEIVAAKVNAEIRAAVAGGTINDLTIPGLRIFEDKEPVSR